jgi:hypothetical protein
LKHWKKFRVDVFTTAAWSLKNLASKFV